MGQEIQIDWDSISILLELVQAFQDAHASEEDVDLRELIQQVGKAVGIEDVDKFVEEMVNKGLGEGLNDVMDDDAAKALAAIFASTCKPVMSAVVAYAKGGVARGEFIAQLNDACFSNAESVQAILEQAFGIPDNVSNALANKFGPYLVSIYCFAMAFKIYKRAADDAALAREKRLEAERLASATIERLEAERTQMESLVNAYMLDRLIPFSAGVSAMDQAIIDNDDDGFIAANAELWRALGHEEQYKTAEEFDDLMLSDEAFRL